MPPERVLERVLVTGGRAFDDWHTLRRELDRIHDDRGISLVIHGACPNCNGKCSADMLAEAWAKSREVSYIGVPARRAPLARAKALRATSACSTTGDRRWFWLSMAGMVRRIV